ncbi:molecular chaperone DnaK [soil metagenome]
MERGTASSVVGIDLGTTYSLAAYMDNGRPEVVRDAAGVALVPSCISFHDDGSVLVGSAAKARALSDPEHTIFSIKRLMGRTLAELKDELKLIPHQIVERETIDGRKVLRVVVAGKEHTPEELSALILKEVRQLAGNPTKAVITVPAYFDDSQRQATRDAGRIAGLDVLRIVNEPTAAALAYGLDRNKTGNVVVYDLGGGTFDCSILTLNDGVFRVLATNGDTFLGGDDFDRTLMEHAAKVWGLDLTQRDPMLLQSLRDQAEKAKITLSTADEATMTHADQTLAISRAEFETLITPLVERSLKKCQSAMKDAKLTREQINDVVMVGGSTRVPLVQQRVAEFFDRKPHTDLNPDEVVAMGAAVQANILATGNRDTLLLDVVPLSLGIETLGGVVDKVIHRNSTVPCRETVRYTTFAEGQTAILLNIYQGERELTKDCRKLGEFKLAGIPPMSAQMAQVDVTFLVDSNGMLTVTAVEKRSGVKAAVEVKASHGLSHDEVENLVMESVDHAISDFHARRFIELKNKADADLRHTRRALDTLGSAVTNEERNAVAAAVATLEAAMAGSQVDPLQKAVDDFGTITAPLAERLMNATVKTMLEGQNEVKLPNERS